MCLLAGSFQAGAPLEEGLQKEWGVLWTESEQ